MCNACFLKAGRARREEDKFLDIDRRLEHLGISQHTIDATPRYFASVAGVARDSNTICVGAVKTTILAFSTLLVAVRAKKHSEIKLLIAKNADMNSVDIVCDSFLAISVIFPLYSLHLVW